MALVTVPGGLWIPEPFPAAHGNPDATNPFLLDASGEKVALLFRAPKTGTLDRFEFKLGTVTQAPASGLKCSFQNVLLTNGIPDETVDENATVTSGLTTGAWVNPGAFSAGRSVTRGDLVAAVIEFASFGAGDSLNVVGWYLADKTFPTHTSHIAHKTGGWTRYTDTLLVALRYTDGSYVLVPSVFPASALNNPVFSAGSTPDERGMRFTVPMACTLQGVLYRVTADAGDTFDVVLYQDSTVLETVTVDTGTLHLSSPYPALALFNSLLLANTVYRVVIKPSATLAITVSDFEVASAAIMDAFGGGQNFHHAQRTDGGKSVV